MSKVHLGSSSNANRSRRLEVSRCASDRKRRLSWTAPFRRTRQTIDRSLRLIEESGRVIEAAERFAARRPLRAGRQYQRVSVWLGQASTHLSCAVRALGVTTAKIVLSPDHASDAPALLLEATAVGRARPESWPLSPTGWMTPST